MYGQLNGSYGLREHQNEDIGYYSLSRWNSSSVQDFESVSDHKSLAAPPRFGFHLQETSTNGIRPRHSHHQTAPSPLCTVTYAPSECAPPLQRLWCTKGCDGECVERFERRMGYDESQAMNTLVTVEMIVVPGLMMWNGHGVFAMAAMAGLAFMLCTFALAATRCIDFYQHMLSDVQSRVAVMVALVVVTAVGVLTIPYGYWVFATIAMAFLVWRLKVYAVFIPCGIGSLDWTPSDVESLVVMLVAAIATVALAVLYGYCYGACAAVAMVILGWELGIYAILIPRGIGSLDWTLPDLELPVVPMVLIVAPVTMIAMIAYVILGHPDVISVLAIGIFLCMLIHLLWPSL